MEFSTNPAPHGMAARSRAELPAETKDSLGHRDTRMRIPTRENMERRKLIDKEVLVPSACQPPESPVLLHPDLGSGARTQLQLPQPITRSLGPRCPGMMML